MSTKLWVGWGIKQQSYICSRTLQEESKSTPWKTRGREQRLGVQLNQFMIPPICEQAASDAEGMTVVVTVTLGHLSC